MAEWTYPISVVIPRGDVAQILLLPAGDRWTLPLFTFQEALYNQLFRLTRAIKAELGADVTLLRDIAQQKDETARSVHTMWLVENRTPQWNPPPDAYWISRDDLDRLTLVDEWMRPTLEHTLDTLMDAPPAERTAWFKAGWFTEAAAWMTRTLQAQGYDLTGEPEPYKHGAISAVLTAQTNKGHVYFKVALNLPLFGNEPLLSAALGQLFPQTIPAPLAIDAERRWMLTADFGTVLRGTKPSLETMERVMRTLARLQIQSIAHLDTLFEARCLDRRLDVLSGQVDGLLADEPAYAKLNDSERAAWQGSGAALKALCEKLAGYGIPNTLVHGDFHAGNVATEGDRLWIFDWTDACVSHPFFDPILMIDYDAKDYADVLREVYLAEWTAYMPIERLREVYEVAKILSALHQAVSYQGIFNGIDVEQKEEWSWGVPRFAQSILAQIKAIDIQA